MKMFITIVIIVVIIALIFLFFFLQNKNKQGKVKEEYTIETRNGTIKVDKDTYDKVQSGEMMID